MYKIFYLEISTKVVSLYDFYISSYIKIYLYNLNNILEIF